VKSALLSFTVPDDGIVVFLLPIVRTTLSAFVDEYEIFITSSSRAML
jgi:hypothetical protein